VSRVLADGAFCNALDVLGCKERGIDLVSPPQDVADKERDGAKGRKSKVGKKGGGKSKGSKSSRRRGRKREFEWLPELDAYRCRAGHLLRRRGQERVWRRDGEQLIRYNYYCPVRYCRCCPEELRCVSDLRCGCTVKRFEGQEHLDEHREKMSRPEYKELYRQRSKLVERCFGDAKQNRGLRKLHGRGLARAKAEVGLMVIAHTILTLDSLCTPPSNATHYTDTS